MGENAAALAGAVWGVSGFLLNLSGVLASLDDPDLLDVFLAFPYIVYANILAFSDLDRVLGEVPYVGYLAFSWVGFSFCLILGGLIGYFL
ncbi:MAG: hypothetical protein GF334_11345 [Candidatus Altiarchaeales archaeon]|nr:hypothetical protein [Candidatus Altiarchaeales archaeon]